jgi:uncharacterized protein YjbI with pentapeptide repeats
VGQVRARASSGSLPEPAAECLDGAHAADGDLGEGQAAAAAGARAAALPLDSRGADLAGRDLRSVDLTGVDLEGANLSGCDLSGVHLLKARLRGADLSRANLCEAELAGADLTGAHLKDTNAVRAGFGMAMLRGAQLFNAKLAGATFSGADLTDADLRCADLRGARLREATLNGCDLTSADLEGADLSMAHVARASFRNATVHDTRLRSLDGFAKADWIGVDIHNINCAGAYRLRRFVIDQNYLKEFRQSSVTARWLYYVWWATSDCGRSVARWGLWIAVQTVFFAWLYGIVGLDYGGEPTALSPLYFSVVTFTTLGYGDVVPVTPLAQSVAMAEVVCGYVMLGGLLSIFSNIIARRGE